MSSVAIDLGADFARAVAAKDHDALLALLDNELDFRGMTPGRVWEGGPADLVHAVSSWFEEDDQVEALEALETDAFADRGRVGYRLRVRNADGLHLVEQQAYFSVRDDCICWLRVMCSGYRPVPG